MPYKFRPAADLATEVEWAKNRRIPPGRYLAELGDHEPPIPPDLMHRVYRTYEQRKREQGFTDFEDVLELAVQLYERDPAAAAAFRERYVAFTVDEYQDVNLLQRTLLDLWLGERDDLCVVGDDYQSIYAFTGAGPEHLLSTPARFPHATVVRLEENYRSTPQVLALANRLVPRLGGAEKTLRAVLPDGPEPELAPFPTAADEDAWIVAEDPRARLPAGGGRRALPDERAAGRLRGGLPRRADPVPGRVAARARGGAVAAAARPAAAPRASRCGGSRSRRDGWRCCRTSSASARSTRQTDLARLVRLAEEFDGDGPRVRGATCGRVLVGRRRTRAASTCSPTTGRRGSSSTRSSCRGSRTRSCPRGRRAPTPSSTRSGGSSTSA